ncbi:hypothetical protein F8P18_23510, partial [Salmonella enterica]
TFSGFKSGTCQRYSGRVTYKQKARTSVQALNLNMAVRGGLTRCARPSGSLLAGSSSVQLAAPVVEPRSVVLIPP